MKRKVRIKKLPKGISLSNGNIIKSVKEGGFTTGDQNKFGLVTFPQFMNGGEGDNETPFFPSAGKVQNTLGPDKREESNIEAEKGETVLTDLNFDGTFELYNIGGKRHSEGGTPLDLPDQSFIYSDTRAMKLSKDEMAEMNVHENKKRTPAWVSKKFPLNKYSEVLNNPQSDHISNDTAEYMLDKNKKKLSHLAFIQEAKKGFEEGVPNAAFPYLKEKGINPEKYTKTIDVINNKENAAMQSLEMEPTDQEKFSILQNFISGPETNQAPPQQEMMPPGPPVGAPPQAMIPQQGPPPQQMMPPPQAMAQPSAAPMMRYGGDLSRFIPKADEGTETQDPVITDFGTNWTEDRNEDLRNAFYSHYAQQIGLEELDDDQKKEIDDLLVKDNRIKSLMHDTFEEDYFQTGDWDGSNDKYNAAIQKLQEDTDWEGTGLDEDQIRKVQNAHIALNTMGRMPIYEEDFGNIGLNMNLSGPEQGDNVGASNTLSGIDGFAGDNFINTYMTSEYTPEVNDTPEYSLPVGKKYENEIPDYWKQDDINVSAAILDKFGIKKRYPTLTKYEPTLVDPMYVDPKRQYAQIAELAAQAGDTARAFAGPKRAAAVVSKAQGEAMAQMANVQAETDNKNIQLYGDSQKTNAQILNSFEEANKKAMSDFADKVNLTEENYDNAMRTANDAIRRQIVNRETNRAKTYNLNALYPHFDIDPGQAGMVNITDYDKFYPTQDYDQSAYETKLNRIKQLRADGLVTTDAADSMLSNLVNTGLDSTPVETPGADVVVNPFNRGFYDADSTSGMYQNPQMMQYLMMQQQQRQQNPYMNMGGSVPSSPFGIKRSRKLRTIE